MHGRKGSKFDGLSRNLQVAGRIEMLADFRAESLLVFRA
jgi:hypothetical protein